MVQRLLQQLDGLESPVGELSPELLQPPLNRVEFGGVGRKRQEAYVFGTDDLSRTMARNAIEHDDQMVVGVVGFGESVEKCLQASSIHTRQVKAEAPSGGGLDRRVEVGPFVGASDDDVGRAEPSGAQYRLVCAS